MEFKINYSGYFMSVVIILLALECSSSYCYEGNVGTLRVSNTGNDDAFLQISDAKFLVGRKFLQVVDEKKSYISEKNKQADTQKNDESEAFLEGADEVANLMRRDYKGAPRRKPPINNHQPKN